jgi:hypothetical protein
MRTIVYILKNYAATVWFGFIEIGKGKWIGIVLYIFAGQMLNNAFILKYEAVKYVDKVKGQLFVLMLIFALFCLYFGGHLILKAKER